MVINKKLQIIISNPPRTGTTTVRKYMEHVEGNDPDLVKDQHEPINQLLWRIPSLYSFTKYVFIRDPWARLESQYRHYWYCKHTVPPVSFTRFAEELGTPGTLAYTLFQRNGLFAAQTAYLDQHAIYLDTALMSAVLPVIAYTPEQPVNIVNQAPLDGTCRWSAKGLQVYDKVRAEELQKLAPYAKLWGWTRPEPTA